MTLSFSLQHQDSSCGARAGLIQTEHGEIQTPIFMPVGTLGTVKGMTPDHLKALGTQILLGNTYHLYLRPGHDLVRAAGGLHRFMAWDGPILTDSGGFQVFSLAKLRRIDDKGVTFQSHIDGSKHVLTPELSIEIQQALGSDIMMCFDECPALPASKERLRESLELTLAWEERSLLAKDPDRNLYSIVQGGTDAELRRESLERLLEIEAKHESKGLFFAGHAIGGLSVGEANELMYETVAGLRPHMPHDKPRYLMGVGTPEDLLHCVEQGIDQFDCVLPTRNARNGSVFTQWGDLKIKQARFREDFQPLDENCSCLTCQNFSRAYLRHLFVNNEMLSGILLTYHNLHYYLSLMKQSREAILDGRFLEFKKAQLESRQRGI